MNKKHFAMKMILGVRSASLGVKRELFDEVVVSTEMYIPKARSTIIFERQFRFFFLR